MPDEPDANQPVQPEVADTEQQNALKSPEDLAYESMNANMDKIAGKRDELIQQLGDSVRGMKLDFANDAPRMIEVKLAAINAYDGILKSQESLHVQKVRVGIQKKTEATSEEVKKMAVEVLRNINMREVGSGQPVAPPDMNALRNTMDTLVEADPEAAIKDEELVVDESKPT